MFTNFVFFLFQINYYSLFLVHYISTFIIQNRHPYSQTCYSTFSILVLACLSTWVSHYILASSSCTLVICCLCGCRCCIYFDSDLRRLFFLDPGFDASDSTFSPPRRSRCHSRHTAVGRSLSGGDSSGFDSVGGHFDGVGLRIVFVLFVSPN